MPDKDVIISAEFEKQKFTVTWQDYDKTVLETDENIEYGTTPSYDGEIPVRQGNAQYKYIFSGWTPSVEAVTDNITYTATYMQPTNTPLLSTVTAAVLSIHRQWNIIKRQANPPPPQKTTAHSTAGLTQMEIPLISAQKSQPISLLRQTGRL